MQFKKLLSRNSSFGTKMLLLVFFLTVLQLHSEEHVVNPGAGNYSIAVPFSEQNGTESGIDNSIDENSYFVGGGDAFRIYIVDMPTLNCVGVVNQNGDLYLSSIGVISVGRVSLSQAKKLIVDYMRRTLKHEYDIHVTLIKTKTAIISISGGGTNAGTYTMSGILRVWDALKVATKDKDIFSSEFDFRSVTVRHNKGDSVDHFDMLPFLFKGDLSQNPYIYPGDNITVSPAVARVYIDGAIKGTVSGWVPIRLHESLQEFLSLFSFDANADSSNISIQQTDGHRHYRTIMFNLKQSQDLQLTDGNIITVPMKEDRSETFVVTVAGEAMRPGEYPIVKGGTGAMDILTREAAIRSMPIR